MRSILAAILILAVTFTACKRAETPKGKPVRKLDVTSPAFKNGDPIPKVYSCEGREISPPLAWKGMPGESKCVTLICEDPDAPSGTFVHWVCWNVPAMIANMPEGIPPVQVMAGGMRQGKNSADRLGYVGPCPPPGKVHHYYFRIYALDMLLDLPDNSNKAAITEAMKGHIVGEGSLMGTYVRY